MSDESIDPEEFCGTACEQDESKAEDEPAEEEKLVDLVGADEVDPDKVLQDYEDQLNSVLAEVHDTDDVDDEKYELQLPGLDLDRRDFMKAGVAVGAATSLAGCSGFGDGGGNETSKGGKGGLDPHVPPGEHDDYYGFWSGGHSGEVRVIGVPSMRVLARIPTFNKDPARGYGYDDETSQMLEEAGGFDLGDSHHPVLSEAEGDYDGKYLWINDKVNGRIARINLKYFKTDAITDIPNSQAIHGMSVQSPDTKYVYGVGEFRQPVPNDGTTDPDNADEYWSIIAALDPESMNVEWEVRVSGNMDNADSSKDGKWAFATGYNDEEAFEIEGMSHDDRDYVKAFDIEAIEAAIDAGKAKKVGGVPVLDGRKGKPLAKGDNPIVHYIPVPKSPHGIDVEPNGKYAIANGKLSPTCSVIDIGKIGEVDDPAKAVVGQPKVGLGPLHTTFDGRGHGYTTLFIDSQVAKWDIEEAVEADMNSEEPIKGKIDVHYNPGHIQAAEAETVDPAGDWLVSLNKLSKDRFLPVGPIHPDNDQLIDISKDGDNKQGGMKLAKDEPVHPEPHDCVIAGADKVDPNVTWDKSDYEGEKPYITADDSAVERKGDKKVHVKMSAKRSEFGLRDFTVKEGDKVRMTVTNVETVRDIIHGVAIPRYNVNLSIAPQDTREVTFKADKPGVYWIYCTYFCSALHLEMRSRMIVEPRD